MAIQRKAITVGGFSVRAGERRGINLRLPHLYSHSEVNMPVHIIHGRRDGPCLFVCAAIHGDEINGVEIIRRLLRTKALERLRGTLIAVPVVNVFGFNNKSRYLPDRRDLNRCFPGSERGSLAGQIAKLFIDNIVTCCTHGIDLHTAAIGRSNLPQIRTDLADSPDMLAMAQAFHSPVILDAPTRDGSLRSVASEYDTQVMLYEAGEALRFDEISIRAGVRGILSTMRHLGMLPPRKAGKPPAASLFSQGSRWVRAPQSGILRLAKSMGEQINSGDIMGYVADPTGLTEEIVYSPLSGILIGHSTLPLVHEGEALFHIARIGAKDDIDGTLKQFHHEIDPDGETHLF